MLATCEVYGLQVLHSQFEALSEELVDRFVFAHPECIVSVLYILHGPFNLLVQGQQYLYYYDLFIDQMSELATHICRTAFANQIVCVFANCSLKVHICEMLFHALKIDACLQEALTAFICVRSASWLWLTSFRVRVSLGCMRFTYARVAWLFRLLANFAILDKLDWYFNEDAARSTRKIDRPE